MSSNIIYEQGSKVLLSAASGDRVAVYTKDVAKVYQVVGYPNHPESRTLLSTVTNGQYISSAFTAATELEIEAGAANVLYQVGTGASIPEVDGIFQEDPAAVDATATITVAELLSKLITSSTAAAVTGTLPTGALLDAAATFSASDCFDWSIVNTGPSTFTVAGDTGHTIVGEPDVLTATSGRFRTRKTAAATFVTYRIG